MIIITIGRGPENKMIIDEPEISRLHAMVRIDSLGKLWIIDKSTNGTYINGVRIASNVPVPVSRKDDVSFAKVRHLDWTNIPDPSRKIKIGALAALAVIALVVLASIIVPLFKSSPAQPVNETPYYPPVSAAPDTTSKQKPAEGKEESKAEQKADDSKKEATSADDSKSEKEATSEESASKNGPDWANKIVEEGERKRAAEAAQKRAAEAAKNAPKPSTATPKPTNQAKPADNTKKPATNKPADNTKKSSDNKKKQETPAKKQESSTKQNNTEQRII